MGDGQLDTMSLTQERFERAQERTVRNQGWESTDGALGIVGRYIDETIITITEKLKDTRALRGTPRAIFDLSPETLALVGLQGGIACVVEHRTLAECMLSIGGLIEREAYAWTLRTWDTIGYERIVKHVKRKYGAIKYRKQAMRSIAARKGFKWNRWSSRDRLIAGKWMVEAIMHSPVFVLGDKDDPYLMLTEEALAQAESTIAQVLKRNYVWLPETSPPTPWVNAVKPSFDGWEQALVRRYHASSRKIVQQHIDDGRMGPTLDAVNAIQSVPWRINEWLMEVIDGCYNRDLHVPGLPPRVDISFPSRPVDGSEDEQAAHRRKVAEVAQVNRGYIGSRIELMLDLQTAKQLAGAPFWTPMNLDYRGRVYGLPRFNFQRQDYVRAMFLFDRGEVLDLEGYQWLMVHAANCGDFDKVSKQDFFSRISWTQANIEEIYACVNRPLEMVDFWGKADKPFMFLAACKALWDATDLKAVCHLPISFDGSCNGLQHLCAMTRAPEGELVNLTQGEAPRDIYDTVATAAYTSMDLDVEHKDQALQALAFGVDRKLVKRATMTYSYGSKKFGMANQLMEDLMKPLSLEVLEGKRDGHPFGDDGGYRASRYLASHIHAAIEATVSYPAAAMRFLQGIARTLAHEGKPLVWHTPLGFPVLLEYPKTTTKQIGLVLHDKGTHINFRPQLQEFTSGIDKNRAANAVAPGFVHSMDACHLMSVVLRCRGAGIRDIALVHDSFGCLPSRATEFRRIIREAFVDLYEETDVLSSILEEAKGQLDTNQWRLPQLPARGSLELRTVLDAEYSFA